MDFENFIHKASYSEPVVISPNLKMLIFYYNHVILHPRVHFVGVSSKTIHHYREHKLSVIHEIPLWMKNLKDITLLQSSCVVVLTVLFNAI